MGQPEHYETWDFEGSSHTVVLDPTGFIERDWLWAVAAEEPQRRFLAVKLRERPLVEGIGPDGLTPDPSDLQAVSGVLTKRGLGEPGDPVDVFPGGVLFPPKPLPEPTELPTAMRRLASAEALDAQLEKLNKVSARDLVEQLRSPVGVIPYIGAGMSAPYGYRLWEDFLHEAGEEFGTADEVDARLAEGDYEGAAQVLDDCDRAGFTEKVRTGFGRRDPPPDLRTGAISYLPLLTTGPVITTNFDPIVEDAFEAVGQELQVIHGPREELTVKAMHRNERVLLKIHGTYEERTFRVFTTTEYERGYRVGDVTISTLGMLTFTNRPLLILGSSVEKDRAIRVLGDIHERIAGLWHYAVVQASHFEERFAERRREMYRLGIRALWYPSGEHDRIEASLHDLVQSAFTREIRKMSRQPASTSTVDTRLGGLNVLTGSSEPHPASATVAQSLREGQVAFVLGAYAHLGSLPLGDEFYAALADEFDVPETELGGDRARVATYIAAHRPPAVLWRAVRSKLEGGANPTVVHQFVAALPAYTRSLRWTRTWILTTNYDTAMEDALRAADEPFHVLHYCEKDGRFVHLAPDGSARVIERPDAVRDLPGIGAVLVKLNGGIAHEPVPDESPVIAGDQFQRLADRIPGVLPACLRTVLGERRLLFLGHGVGDCVIERLLDEYTADQPDSSSWAVRPRPDDPEAVEVWNRRTSRLLDLGLETIDADLETFLGDLRFALLRR
jgi:hypothetical protein